DRDRPPALARFEGSSIVTVQPQTTRANDRAVVAPARVSIDVVPSVRRADALTVVAFVCHAQSDQPPREPSAKPSPPLERVALRHDGNGLRRAVLVAGTRDQRLAAETQRAILGVGE